MFTDEFIFDLQRFGEFSNEYDSKLISGTSAADTISNAGNLVTIKGGAGDDSIFSSTHSNESLVTDDNTYGYGYVTIDAGKGNDTIWSNDPYVSLNGGAGNDYIEIGNGRASRLAAAKATILFFRVFMTDIIMPLLFSSMRTATAR